MTVDQLHREVLPEGTEVVAGAVGLDRDVTWPVTLRTRPPAFPHLKGGEIALITTEAIRLLDPSLQLATVLRSLAGVGAAAAAVVGDVPPDARDLANSVGLPILRLPPGSHLPDLEQAIARTIVDRRTELHQRSQDMYRRLTELAIEGRGVEAILRTIADLTRKAVVLETRSFEVRASASPTSGPPMTIPVAALGEDADRIHAWLARTTLSASEPPTLRLSVGEALGRTLAPIAVKDDILGFLSIVGRRGTLSDVDDLAASRGAAACAIELSRERAVLEAEDRLHADVVEALLTGSYQSPEAIITRARRLGFDLHGEYTAVVLAADAASSGSPDRHRRARAELERAIERRGLAAMTGARSDRLVILIPRDAAGSTAPQTLAADLCEALREVFDTSFSAGVGLAHAGVDGIRQAYREADGALGIGLAVFGAGRVCHYADLGLYRVLLAIRDTPELEAFRRETLGALLDYDGRNDGELIKTLEAYFAALGSPTDAAARLHVHRNTLLYRLKRIQEIAGVDLDDAEARLALHLALRAGDVSGAAGPPGRTAQISRPPFRTGRT